MYFVVFHNKKWRGSMEGNATSPPLWLATTTLPSCCKAITSFTLSSLGTGYRIALLLCHRLDVADGCSKITYLKHTVGTVLREGFASAQVINYTILLCHINSYWLKSYYCYYYTALPPVVKLNCP